MASVLRAVFGYMFLVFMVRVVGRRPGKQITPFFKNMLGENRKRSFLGFVLMIAQSFFFNAVFFTYSLVVQKFYRIPSRYLPLHLLPFALGSFLGPLVLGHLMIPSGESL